ncbi:hypothetical protein Lal_00045286 [Lupinus albus]|nr:hypothetical protein Lal_00045286 [Lupinus albus]
MEGVGVISLVYFMALKPSISHPKLNSQTNLNEITITRIRGKDCELCNHCTRDDGTLIACAATGSISQARGTEMAAQLTTTSGCQ